MVTAMGWCHASNWGFDGNVLYALDHHVARLADDHALARHIGAKLANYQVFPYYAH